MKTRTLVATITLFLGAVAWAQLRITSLSATGNLSWTNSIYRGLYNVEWANSPTGVWSVIASVVDSDYAKTNVSAIQVPPTNSQSFYRVGWLPPDPTGIWDYRSYDNQGALLTTGVLNLVRTTLATSNSPVVYNIRGTWNFQYAGPQTSNLPCLGPQIGSDYLYGTVEVETAKLYLKWPTNSVDFDIQLSGSQWANNYTGTWFFWPNCGGPFTATRR